MKQFAQQVRSTLFALIMAGMTGAATAAGAGGGADANVGADGQPAGVSADAHMSTAGSSNSNAQWKSGATEGAERAADRMSTYGADMKQSGGAADASGKGAVKGKR